MLAWVALAQRVNMACLSCYLLGSGFLLLFLQLFRLRAGRRCASQGARQDTLLQLAGPRQLRQPEALEAAPVRSRRRRSRSPGLLQLAVGRGQRSLGALLGGSSEEEAPAPAPMPAPKKSPSGSGSDSGSSESEPTPTHALELSEPEEPEPTPVWLRRRWLRMQLPALASRRAQKEWWFMLHHQVQLSLLLHWCHRLGLEQASEWIRLSPVKCTERRTKRRRRRRKSKSRRRTTHAARTCRRRRHRHQWHQLEFRSRLRLRLLAWMRWIHQQRPRHAPSAGKT